MATFQLFRDGCPAAAEAAVGLAIILTVFKNRSTARIDEVNSMRL